MSKRLVIRSVVSVLVILVIGGGAVAVAWYLGAFDPPTHTRGTPSVSRVITLPPTPIPPTPTTMPTPTPAPCPGTVPGDRDDQIVDAVSEAQEAYDAVFPLVYELRRNTNLIVDETWRTSLRTGLDGMADAADTLDCLLDRGFTYASVRDLVGKLRIYEGLISKNFAAYDAEGITSVRNTQRDISDLLPRAKAAPVERRKRVEQAKVEREAAARAADQAARDARAGIATVEGRGTSAERVTLSAGTHVVKVSWSGNSRGGTGTNFAIWLDGAGLRCSLLVNTIGASGSESHFCNVEGGTVRIQVEAAAAASWSIRFERD